jgi:hypothetical protein
MTKANQLTRGRQKRLMYVENKGGEIDGSRARIGWVTFSKTGKSIFYRGVELSRLKGGGVSGNYFDCATGAEFWVSGVKLRGSNAHWAESVSIAIDDDAKEAYAALRSK